mmetsp:Transcript_32444/g.48340  ORF Transcript_32444/g.48340 Transcript_32444/m.48340 type:complete len:161 (-) Transcript_32444:697-1179(-)
MREDLLAKRMFLGGCLLLPWLWAVNAFYFRRKVYGDLPFIDVWPSWCCWGSSTGETSREGADEGIEELVPRMGGVIEMGGGSGGEDGDDGNQEEEQEDNPNLTPAEIEMELSKWVKRSTLGAFVGFTLFITWIVVFQVHKDSFGDKWFVMSVDKEDLTGW